jgi:glycosyltransferase involved in cell wall biosynthesis
MRVLVAHNSYRIRGGEDVAVEAEVDLLRRHGHDVRVYGRANRDIAGIGALALARDTVWSSRTAEDIATEIDRFRPELIHAHNTVPLISPSLYWAAHRRDVPVVQSLHNFRLVCLNGLLLRKHQPCEDCVGKAPWRGVVRRCYKDSASASAVLASMLGVHRAVGTYRGAIARYIALSEFSRRKFIEGGLPAERIVVKPNFAERADGPTSNGCARERNGFLFAGRLAPEKGIETLAEAVRLLPDVSLRVAGSGEEAKRLQDIPGVALLGHVGPDRLRSEMRQAVALVVPSICYENCPRSIIEAYEAGLPVIASRTGALEEMVRDGENGLLFRVGDSRDLAEKMGWARGHRAAMNEMGKQAKLRYSEAFSPEVNYQRLLDIYHGAISEG